MKAEEVADPHAPPKIAKVTKSDAVGVSCPEESTNTGANDAGDGYLLFFQNLQYAQVGESPGETPAQGEGDPRS
jgi:hypothetical protein